MHLRVRPGMSDEKKQAIEDAGVKAPARSGVLGFHTINLRHRHPNLLSHNLPAAYLRLGAQPLNE